MSRTGCSGCPVLAGGGDGENGVEVAQLVFERADAVFHLRDELYLAVQLGEFPALLGEVPGGAVALVSTGRCRGSGATARGGPPLTHPVRAWCGVTVTARSLPGRCLACSS